MSLPAVSGDEGALCAASPQFRERPFQPPRGRLPGPGFGCGADDPNVGELGLSSGSFYGLRELHKRFFPVFASGHPVMEGSFSDARGLGGVLLVHA